MALASDVVIDEADWQDIGYEQEYPQEGALGYDEVKREVCKLGDDFGPNASVLVNRIYGLPTLENQREVFSYYESQKPADRPYNLLDSTIREVKFRHRKWEIREIVWLWYSGQRREDLINKLVDSLRFGPAWTCGPEKTAQVHILVRGLMWYIIGPRRQQWKTITSAPVVDYLVQLDPGV